MKKRALFPALIAIVATALAAGLPSLFAKDERPPLKLQVDQSAIDRNAPQLVSYAPIVKRTAASIVYVYSTKRVKRSDLAPYLNDPIFRRFFNIPDSDSGPGRNNSGRRVPEQTEQGLGSGVVITADGYILTNNHVVEGADEVKVSIGESSKRYDATVVGADALADIAVLRIKADGLSPAVFGDSDQLQVGDTVFAIGNPFGIGQSVSRGIVSALGRGNLGIEAFEDFIQTDAAINPGNSGGALIDTQGRIVGLNTAILSRTGGFAGVGFAIPINLARRSAEQIVATGRVNRGFLGVAPQDLTPELSAQFTTERGALVAEVTSGSPAEKAGLQEGDVITKVNSDEIRDARHLLLVIAQLAPDTEVKLDYLRDGKPHTATAKLTRRPDRFGADSKLSPNGSGGADVGVLNGVAVGDLTPELRSQLQVPERIQGAVVTDVSADSPSAAQGLREGDVIVSLDRKPVHNAEEAVKLSEEIKGPKVLVRVWRDGRSQFLVIDESKK